MAKQIFKSGGAGSGKTLDAQIFVLEQKAAQMTIEGKPVFAINNKIKQLKEKRKNVAWSDYLAK